MLIKYLIVVFFWLLFRTPNALLDGTGEQDVRLCKSDIALSFYVEVTVVEVQNLKNVNGGKIVFCTMELEGDKRLQTDHAEANKPQSVV